MKQVNDISYLYFKKPRKRVAGKGGLSRQSFLYYFIIHRFLKSPIL